MTEQSCLDIIIWNVGHGSATSVRLPNGNVIMLDCGSNPETGFSPVRATLRIWDRIDALFISHPHMDHIGDICSLSYLPRFLVSPPVPTPQVLEGKRGPDLATSSYYAAFRDGYRPIPSIPQEFFGGVAVRHFYLDGPHNDMNAYSIATFLQHGWLTFLYAGDLPSSHWPKLISSPDRQFASLLSATNFLEVPHHGRDEGYNADAMSIMADPKLAFVSDKEEQETSVTEKYGPHFNGWPAYNTAAEHWVDRKVLTTRNDGCIRLRSSILATPARQFVVVRFGVRHG